MSNVRIWSDILAERVRQGELHAAGRIPFTLDNPGVHDHWKLAVIHEESGEVARAVQDLAAADETEQAEAAAHLREELVQLAACAVAMIEGLDARGDS